MAGGGGGYGGGRGGGGGVPSAGDRGSIKPCTVRPAGVFGSDPRIRLGPGGREPECTVALTGLPTEPVPQATLEEFFGRLGPLSPGKGVQVNGADVKLVYHSAIDAGQAKRMLPGMTVVEGAPKLALKT